MKKLKLGKEKPEKEEKSKVKRITVNSKKCVVIFLWLLLISSFIFAVYKNFTAIDIHTVHEKEVIHEQVINTNKIENFVTDFAKVYYSWQQDRESLDKRNNNLASYMTVDLVTLNNNMVRSDIPVVSSVSGINIWNVEKVNDTDYSVLYSVTQTIKEGEASKSVNSVYDVKVHLDVFGNMVIIKNPTVSYLPEKSGYIPAAIEYDSTVDNVAFNEIKVFLETFFKLYPKATEQELVYYVKDNMLKGIDNRFVFSELANVVCKKENDNIRVYANVEYLDNTTKTIQISQFDLLLQKLDGNWKIVGVNK